MNENSSLPDSPEVGKQTLAQRLAFLQMTEDDRQRLRALAPRLNASSDAFVEQFYRHLFSFKETARFLEDPDVVARLKRMQQAHLQSMLEDDVNEDYIAQRRRVGDIHAHVGISPQMFLGAYNQYLQYGLKELATTPDLPMARIRRADPIALEGGLPGRRVDARRLLCRSYPESASGARYGIPGEYRIAAIRSAYEPRSQDAAGDRRQFMRRGLG